LNFNAINFIEGFFQKIKKLFQFREQHSKNVLRKFQVNSTIGYHIIDNELLEVRFASLCGAQWINSIHLFGHLTKK
jgi:hypothetical protein